MFRLFLVVVLAVVVVQAHPGKGGNAGKVRGDLQKLIKTARRVTNVPNDKLIKASCVNEFSFVPTTKDAVEKSQKCLADIKTVSDLLVDMKDERTMFVQALTAASEKPHNAFDLVQLAETAGKYLKKLQRQAKEKKVSKEDQDKYVNDCVMPVLEDIKKNAMAAEEKVKACFAKA